MIIKKGDKVVIEDGLWKGKVGKVSEVFSDCMVQLDGIGTPFYGKNLTKSKKKLTFPTPEAVEIFKEGKRRKTGGKKWKKKLFIRPIGENTASNAMGLETFSIKNYGIK